MLITRHEFLRFSAIAGAGAIFAENNLLRQKFAPHLRRLSAASPHAAARDEDFWAFIRSQFTLSDEIVNLNNGGVSPQPIPVQEAHIKHYRYCNLGPSHYMWHVLDKGREELRARLARSAGCEPDELAINRNTTEGLNTIIFGLDLQRGDEVVLSKYDYPNMMNAWKQRQKRDGIKLNWVDLNLPEEDEEVIVEKFRRAITPRTKIVHVTHMINWTGQILPARKIADMAHAYGCEVIVDASHTYAHIPHSIRELDCDYYATSLHKWLCAPFGTGFMFIKKEKIKKVWALLSAPEPDGSDIRKFENLGTRSFAAEHAIHAALDFQEMIGNERKAARLHYLKNYWCEKIRNTKGIKLYTSLHPQFSGALATVGIQGKNPPEIVSTLLEKYRLHTTSIVHENVNGIRITPHVYTTTEELDRLIHALQTIASS
ncbi:MAG: aminotransferase class V-fold PLP-dependent enzyme [Chitinophagales bacterium]|nr:aminotransferase class V-fold PLP-dependent enzyme [Chitinophagales bacterium]MDW8417920.1 aminotransferase class V-fold PLP-dependent enzyme [Chitinophagales bacterium]